MSHLLPFNKPGGIEIVKSQGCFLFDREGKRYIDMESGVWCTNLGHNHPRVNRAIARQLEQVQHTGLQVKNSLPEKLSKALHNKLRFQKGKSVFLSSGSEAVDLSISIAKHISGRAKICMIDGSYLSAFGHGKSSTDKKFLTRIPADNFEKLSSCNFDNIGAFVFEPGTSWGLIQFPSAGFVSAMVKKAKSADSLVVVDEVTTGMCRTGKWFGFEHYGFKPDIVVCGKGLGNGYPVSSVSLNNATTIAFEKKPFRYAQSHQNDPLACSAALQVIKEMDRTGLVTKTEEKGILFKSLLKEIAIKHNDIKEIRGRGLMLAIDFHNKELAEKVHNFLLQQRVITGLKNNVIRLMPPLVIDDGLIHEVADTIENAILMLNPG